MIPVTKPFLPPIEDYEQYVRSIWKRQWLTNNGPLVNELELSLKNYLNLKHLLYISNGTIAIQIAIKALELKGEIITTPFSYVATTSSIVWENCNPVFVDIDVKSLNINPALIEEAITPNTTAILATHCFGNACEIDKIQAIAEKYNLKVIYDAAHCFGTTYKGKSIFEFGDISTTSFHATKLYHTIEGGAVFTQQPNLLKRMAYMRNFGHDGPESFQGLGVNGKNSEFHAAMGLCNLKYINEILIARKEQSLYYDQALQGLNISKPTIQQDCIFNYAYYPIIFESEIRAIEAKSALEQRQIYPRRYFFPSLSSLPYLKHVNMPISDSISKRILCLPLYQELSKEEQDMIARILLRTQNYTI
jgi:dTDP-4-amino-4,6-dideoxygalactose transaminase